MKGKGRIRVVGILVGKERRIYLKMGGVMIKIGMNLKLL